MAAQLSRPSGVSPLSSRQASSLLVPAQSVAQGAEELFTPYGIRSMYVLTILHGQLAICHIFTGKIKIQLDYA